MVILLAVVTLRKSSASPSRANNFYFVRGRRHSSVIESISASPARTENPAAKSRRQKLDGFKPSSFSSNPILLTLVKSALTFPPPSCELRLSRMFPFAEFLDHLLVEGRYVIRFATGHQSIVDHYFLVDPLGARVLHICLDCRPGRQPASAHHTSIDQHPRAVANRRHRFVLFEEMSG